MISLASNFLIPDATFWLELLVLIVLVVAVAAAVILLVIRSMRRPSPTDELVKLAQLRDAGKLSEAEFDQLKARILP